MALVLSSRKCRSMQRSATQTISSGRSSPRYAPRSWSSKDESTICAPTSPTRSLPGAQLIGAYNHDLVEQWRGTLLNLSESFVRGEAQVDPHVYPKSCQYCPLDGVCRVVESRGTACAGRRGRRGRRNEPDAHPPSCLRRGGTCTSARSARVISGAGARGFRQNRAARTAIPRAAADAEEPEQVLAITFTRKATAEMRVRVLHALEGAGAAKTRQPSEHEREVRRLAQAALAHAAARGWQLTEQPQRLNIQTIDSLALSIASHCLCSRGLAASSPHRRCNAALRARSGAHVGAAWQQSQPELADALADIAEAARRQPDGLRIADCRHAGAAGPMAAAASRHRPGGPAVDRVEGHA